MGSRVTEDALVDVESAAQLVRDVGVKIEGVAFRKLSAELRDDLDEGNLEIGEIVPTYGLKTRADGDAITIRLSTHLTCDVGDIDVDVAVSYRTPRPIKISTEATLEFANEVGIMTLIPYVREAISTLSQRCFGEAILMPIFQRGELSFTSDDRDQDPLTK